MLYKIKILKMGKIVWLILWLCIFNIICIIKVWIGYLVMKILVNCLKCIIKIFFMYENEYYNMFFI